MDRVERGSVVLGRYEVVERLGSGGFGVVWRARDTVLGRDVALKRVEWEPDAQRPTVENRALREGRALAQVSHPGAVAIHDLVLDGDLVWLVLEYVAGSSLDLLVARNGRWPPGEVARLGAALADVLAHGHALDLVHRDVKPANVLVDGRGPGSTVKLADYGLAGVLARDDAGDSRQRHGSLRWASPEWARNEPVTAASDVFSLGATLFHVVEGRPPFADEPGRPLALEVAAAHVLPARHAGVLGPVLDGMLHPDPASRPGAADVAASLAALADVSGEHEHRTTEAPFALAIPRPARNTTETPSPSRRARVGLVLTVAVIATVLAGALWVALPVGMRDDPLTLPASGLEPVLFTGDERDVDPCAVVDTDALTRYGDATITPGPYFSACTVQLRHPDSAVGSRLTVDVFRGADSVAGRDERHPLGAGYVVRRPATEGCRATVTLTIDVSIALRTLTDDPTVDACRLVDAAVALTVRGLNEQGLVGVPGRTAGWPLAVVDACTLATEASLSPVGLEGQLRGPQSNGWGRWDCRWGREVAGTPRAHIVLRLENDNEVLGRGPVSIVGGRTLVTELGDGDQNPRYCRVAALWQPVTQPPGLFQVVEAQVEAPMDDARLCRASQEMATIAVDLLDAES